jgi:chromosome segregation ATPase
MEYTQVTALVPEKEHFDATAVNEGVWVSQGHLGAIETRLQQDSTAIAAHATEVEGLGGQIISLNEQVTASATELANANETIAAKDTEIAALNAKITELENKTEEPKQTTKVADETGKKNVKKESAMDSFADSLLGPPKPKQA